MPHENHLNVSRQEMVAIRDTVRAKLVHEMHAYLLTARLWRKAGNPVNAKLDEVRATELKFMIQAITDEDDEVQRVNVLRPPAGGARPLEGR